MPKVYLFDQMRAVGTGLPQCRESILANPAGEIIYLTPTPAMARRVQKMARQTLPPGGCLHVISFDVFARETVQSHYPDRFLLTPDLQRLIVAKAIQACVAEGAMQPFTAVAAYPGFVKAVEGLLGEWKRAGTVPADLANWAKGNERRQVLVEIFAHYQGLLSRYGLMDHEEAYRLAAEVLPEAWGQKSPALVVAEGFFDLLPLQRQLLRVMEKLGVPVVLFLARIKGPAVFQLTDRTLSGLVAEAVETVAWWETAEPLPAGLQHVEQNCFTVFPPILPADGSIHLMFAPSIIREAGMIAGEIKRLVADGFVAAGDVAVVVRDTAQYREVLVQALARNGVPCAAAEEFSLAASPLFNAITCLLDAIMGDLRRIPNLVRSPYFTWGRRRGTELFAETFTRWGYPAGLGQWMTIWQQEIQRARQQELQRGNTFELPTGLVGRQPNWYVKAMEDLPVIASSIYGSLGDLPRQGTVQEIVHSLRQLMERLRVASNAGKVAHRQDDTAWRVATGDLSALQELEQVLDHLELAAEITGLSKEQVDLHTFKEQLELAAEYRICSSARGQGGGVAVLDAPRCRGLSYKVVFVAGLAQGLFPHPITPDWLLPEDDRQELLDRGIEVDTMVHRYQREEYLFYLAVTRATHRLYLSCPGADDSGEGLPSIFLDEVKRLFLPGSLPVHHLPQEELVASNWDGVAGVAEAGEKLFAALWSRENDPVAPLMVPVLHSLEGGALNQRLAAAMMEEDRFGPVYGRWDGVLGDTGALAAKLGENHVFSVSQLNLLIQCPFAFFARIQLNLEPPAEEEEDLTALERGNLLHQALYRFFTKYRGQLLDQGERDALHRELNGVFDQVCLEFAAGGGVRHPVLWELARARIRAVLAGVLDYELSLVNLEGALTPQWLELGFGLPLRPDMDPASTTNCLELGKGQDRVLVRGKIDRVDMAPDGTWAAFDYKSGQVPSYTELREGHDIQVALYLLALERVMGLARSKGAGGGYYTLQNPGRNHGLWRSDLAQRVGVSSRPENQIPPESWDSLLSKLERLIITTVRQARSGYFPARPLGQCPPYCPYPSVCRFDAARMGGKKVLQ